MMTVQDMLDRIEEALIIGVGEVDPENQPHQWSPEHILAVRIRGREALTELRATPCAARNAALLRERELVIEAVHDEHGYRKDWESCQYDICIRVRRALREVGDG